MSYFFLCGPVETFSHDRKTAPDQRAEKQQWNPQLQTDGKSNADSGRLDVTFQSHRFQWRSTQNFLSTESQFHHAQSLDRAETDMCFNRMVMCGLHWVCKCVSLTAAGQCDHIGGLGCWADTPAIGCSNSELIVTTRNQIIKLYTLLPAAGWLLPKQRVWRRRNMAECDLSLFAKTSGFYFFIGSDSSHWPSCLYSTV